jgi:hypothetical protein
MKINYEINNRIACGLAVVVFSFFISMISYAGSANPTETKPNQETVFPPKNVVSTIKGICPSCDIVTLNDLANEARSEFLGMSPHGNPGWVKGDFNGDGFIDYALLLRNKENGKNYLRLIALLSSGNKFIVKNLRNKYEGHSFWYLGLMPAGTVAKHTLAFAPSGDTPAEVKLKYPAIEYFKAGSSMSVFYFKNGEFHMIPVSD